MKIKLTNNLEKQISFAALPGSGPGKPNWVDLPKQAHKEFDDKDRFLAFKVPTGQGFSISPKTRLLFEFVQVKINDPNYKGFDTYVFRVTNFDNTLSVASSGGDADIDPPLPNEPLND